MLSVHAAHELRVAVIGSGYVGTTLAASLADLGHRVVAIDIEESVVDAINEGRAPLHEPGLDELVAEHGGDRLRATTEYEVLQEVDLAFLAVQTPSDEEGRIDVGPLSSAARMAGAALAEIPGEDRPVLVIKSTVVPPQIETIRNAVADGAGDRETLVAMNPEFLREGTAVEDFRTPDKLVFGTSDDRAETLLRQAFQPIIDEAVPAVIATDPETAAMIKYANNAFLAAKISLINDIGNICKEFGIDAYEVAEAIGTDSRIGSRFLRSGVGFGGSCFPKDVNAIVRAAEDAGYDPEVLAATLSLNERQPERMLELLEDHLDPAGARIAVLGLAFKPGTDDIRESRAIPVIEGLLERDAAVVAYDPIATDNMRDRIPDIEYARTAGEALDGAAAALVVTGWDEFEALDDEFDAMAEQIVIDGRRAIEPQPDMTYEGLTW